MSNTISKKKSNSYGEPNDKHTTVVYGKRSKIDRSLNLEHIEQRLAKRVANAEDPKETKETGTLTSKGKENDNEGGNLCMPEEEVNLSEV